MESPLPTVNLSFCRRLNTATVGSVSNSRGRISAMCLVGCCLVLLTQISSAGICAVTDLPERKQRPTKHSAGFDYVRMPARFDAAAFFLNASLSEAMAILVASLRTGT